MILLTGSPFGEGLGLTQVSNYIVKNLSPARILKGSGLPRPKFLNDREAWSFFLKEFERLKLSPCFLKNITSSTWFNDIPDIYRFRIEESYHRQALIGETLKDEMVEATTALSAMAIPSLLVGGADLKGRFYPKNIVRRLDRVELLVRPEKLHLALKALGKKGYRIVDGFKGYRSSHELSRYPDSRVVHIEVRTSLFEDNSSSEIDGIWRRSLHDPKERLNEFVRVMSHEDLFIYLLRCAATHFEVIGKELVDLFFLLHVDREEEILNWSRISFLLEQKKLKSSCFFVFRLLEGLWGQKFGSEIKKSGVDSLGKIRRYGIDRLVEDQSWHDAEKSHFYRNMGLRAVRIFIS